MFNLAWEIHDPRQVAFTMRTSTLVDGIAFFKRGMVDYCSSSNYGLLKDAVDVAISYISSKRIIMGHCEGGRNRTFLWLICLRRKLFKESLDQAMKVILAVRPEMALHGWEKDLLDELEAEGYFA